MKFLGFNFFARKRQVEIPPQVEQEELMFMNCVIKMNRLQKGWQKARIQIIDCIQVRNYKGEQDGTMILSGMCHPTEFLRTISNCKKKAELCWFEYGNCSSYLYGPSSGVPCPPPPNQPSNMPAASANDQAARGTGIATRSANDQAARSGNATRDDNKIHY